jgi:hypothetical protein
MTMTRLLMRAWAAAVAAAGFGFLYLAYAPIQSSHAADTALTIALSGVGAVVGVWIETSLAARVSARRSRADVIELTTDVTSYERVTARGA